MQSTGWCDKCGTNAPLYEVGEMMLCKSNYCYYEELEKLSGKHIEDREKLEDYRKLIEATKNVPITVTEF